MRLQKVIWTWTFSLFALVVLIVALMPAPPRLLSTGWDKSNHLLAYCVLMWLGCKAFAPRIEICALGLLAHGGLIEILQFFTPNRSTEWMDWAADSMGILVGWALWRCAKQLGRYKDAPSKSLD